MSDEQPAELSRYTISQELDMRSLYSQAITTSFELMRWLMTEAATRHRPIEVFKLTQKQCNELKAEVPAVSGWNSPFTGLLGIPVQIVEDVQDSTPFKYWLAEAREKFAAMATMPPPWLPYGPTATEGGEPALP